MHSSAPSHCLTQAGYATVGIETGQQTGIIVTEINGAVVGAITGRTGATLAGGATGDSNTERLLTIRELARDFGITLRALRFYENKGMIAPQRRGASRLYSPADRDRLALILAGKRLGFTLAEIRRMAATQDGRGSLDLTEDQCVEQIALLEEQKRSVDQALADLRRMHAALTADAVAPTRIAC